MGRSLTFFCYTALLLGGAATIFGPVLGSVLFFAGRIFIQTASQAYVPNSILTDQKTAQFSLHRRRHRADAARDLRPQGILGNKRELRFDV